MRTFDVAIIGGGIAGLSLASFLSPHRSVVLLERETAFGYHSTGRSAAEFVLRYNAPEICALAAIAKSFFDTPPDGFCDIPLLKRRGGLMIAAQEKVARLNAVYHAERQFAPHLERLETGEALERYPILNPQTLAAAYFDPDFWDIEVESLLQGYVRTARRHGAELRTGETIASATHDGQGWTIATQTDSLRALLVVNAAGGWADPTAEQFGLPPIGIVPHRRTAITVDLPDSIDAATLPEINEIDEEFYMKPDAGRLLASPADATPCEPADVQPEDIDIAWAAHHVEQATVVKVGRIASSWAGMRSFSKNRLPVIGADPSNPDFFWLAGQGGYGILTSPALGAFAAGLLAGDRNIGGFGTERIDPAQFDPGRYRSSPE